MLRCAQLFYLFPTHSYFAGAPHGQKPLIRSCTRFDLFRRCRHFAERIDYVVNCSNRKLSMADFKVLTGMSAQTTPTTDRGVAELSFYQPVIQHDINIVENVCGGKLAMGKASSVN